MPSLKDNLTALGFDFGLRRIGVAVGQGVTGTAEALAPLLAKDGTPDWTQLSDVIEQWGPDALVVGIPFNMDGTKQKITFAAENFAKELKERYKLTVYEVDERLSTVEARSQLFEEGGSKKIRSSSVDSYVAKLLLEQWFSE